MSWLLRPSILILVWTALTVGALLLMLHSTWQAAPAYQALARPVPAGDQELAWFQAATNTVAWERFVAGVQLLRDRPGLGVTAIDDSNAFPNQTTAVPELAISVRGSNKRLWLRWYKLTGDLEAAQWIRALLQRNPPPLAIIGGSSSDRARDLAQELEDSRAQTAAPPLLLITMATANQVEVEDQADQDLMKIYGERSFRFCYTNRQMAEAVVDFIWSQPDLRPDTEPVYGVHWRDDPYSRDLFLRFGEVLGEEGYGQALQRGFLTRAAARKWARLAGVAAAGGLPPGLHLEGLRCEDLAMPRALFWSREIPYSLGTFGQPNSWEAVAAEQLVDELVRHPSQRRPLLIVPAMPQPARRFLRGLLRTDPTAARDFVVASGDALDFNTIYRDRRMAWNIQDLPFALVFFCHRNPVDPVAFEPDRGAAAAGTSTGTQDLLLYRDIVGTLVAAAYQDGRLLADADALRARLRAAQDDAGRLLFDAHGNPRGGTGEYVVSLRPVPAGQRVLPQAILQVWDRKTDADGTRRWERAPIAGEPELRVDYLRAP